MQLSYNKLKTFGECALKYRYTYIERLPRPPVQSLAFHRRLHAALAKYHHFAKRDGAVRLEELLDAYARLCGAETDPQARQTKAYQEGEEILRLYCEKEGRTGRVPAYLEYRARVEFGPHILTGAIDRLDFTPTGGYSLIDYKLDRELPENNTAEDSLQLSFYHLLVYEALGVAPDDVRLYFLRHGVEQVSYRTRRQMRETVEWIDAAAARIQAEKRWQPCEGDACRTCAFWNVCPARTGRERPNAPVWRQGEMLELSGAARPVATEQPVGAQATLDLL
jgi:RecB family exonuclease